VRGLILLIAALVLAIPSQPYVRRPAAKAAVPPGIPAAWKHLSLHDEVAQLVIVPFTGQALAPRSKQMRELTTLVRTQHVGGLILVNVFEGHLVQRADPVEAAKVINHMQKLARIPLLVGADLERGASMRFNNTTVFPHAMAFAAGGDPAAARYEGQITAREARAIGVNWVFFPDADVNSNPDNPIINIRSYSEDPKQVSEYVVAFLGGAASDPHYRVLTTAKHFPGHGDTATDTHLNMATISADRKHLDEVELVPFRAAIAQGVDSIMTAHLAVPALETADLPATLSPAILTNLLRNELGFKGIVVTDALDMGGVAKGFSPGDAAVRAIEAGADVLLMPGDPVAAINAVVAAVKEGRISKKRLDDSLDRVLAAKLRVGLNVTRYVNTRTLLKAVNQPEPNRRAMEIAQHAVTLDKNDYHLLPIAPGSDACFAILREGPNSQEGAAILPQINKRAPGRPALMLDPSMSEADLDHAVEQAGTCSAWYVEAYVSVAGYRGNVSLGGNFPQLLAKLIGSGKPVMLVSLGNPYLLRSFPNVAGYMTTFSTVPPSEVAAVEALYGEIPIHGHMPITIPGLTKFGDGISTPATAAAPRSTPQ
jgi:beta-N-acetylhexosaminidase